MLSKKLKAFLFIVSNLAPSFNTSEMLIILSKNFLDKAIGLVNELFPKDVASEFTPKVLIMKDVTIRSISSNQVTNLPVFNVFVDQIVGYSFGHID